MDQNVVTPKTCEYKPLPSLVPAHQARQQVKAVCGPVGSGKSSWLVWEIILMAEAMARKGLSLRAVIIRDRYANLRDSTLKTWLEWAPPGVAGKWNGEDKVFYLNLGGRTHEVLFRHAQTAADASNFLSSEYAVIAIEEPVPAFTQQGIMTQGISQEVFTMALMRNRQSGCREPHVLLTFNPPTPRHWCNIEFLKKTPEELAQLDRFVVKQPPKENEVNLPPNYYNSLEANLPLGLVRRFVFGEVVPDHMGMAVFGNEFSETVHTRLHIPPLPGVQFVRGWDFALFPACVWVQVTPKLQARALLELQGWNIGIDVFSDMVLKEHAAYFGNLNADVVDWGDPSGWHRSDVNPELCAADILIAKGIKVGKGPKELTARIEPIKQRLLRIVDGEPGIIIDKTRCPILTEGFLGGYAYAVSRDGRIMSHEPMKNEFSHSADALQMVIARVFGPATFPERRPEEKKQIPFPFRRNMEERKRGANWLRV